MNGLEGPWVEDRVRRAMCFGLGHNQGAPRAACQPTRGHDPSLHRRGRPSAPRARLRDRSKGRVGGVGGCPRPRGRQPLNRVACPERRGIGIGWGVLLRSLPAARGRGPTNRPIPTLSNRYARPHWGWTIGKARGWGVCARRAPGKTPTHTKGRKQQRANGDDAHRQPSISLLRALLTLREPRTRRRHAYDLPLSVPAAAAAAGYISLVSPQQQPTLADGPDAVVGRGRACHGVNESRFDSLERESRACVKKGAIDRVRPHSVDRRTLTRAASLHFPLLLSTDETRHLCVGKGERREDSIEVKVRFRRARARE